MKSALVAVLVLAAVAAGCGSAEQEPNPPADQVIDESAVGTGGVAVDPVVPCAQGEARPITVQEALAALRRHGFSMRIEDCVGGADVVAGVTNYEEADDVLAREGLVSCHVHQRPHEGARSTVVRRGVDGGDAEPLLANLNCTILADSPDAEARIDPLEAAFEELQRAIRP